MTTGKLKEFKVKSEASATRLLNRLLKGTEIIDYSFYKDALYIYKKDVTIKLNW